MGYYLLAFGVAVASALLLTPVVRTVALRLKVIDVPEDRKVHRDITPTLGGVAIFLSYILAVGVFILVKKHPISSDLVGVVLGSVVILIFGVIDDVRGLSPLMKLFGQIAAAGTLIFMGVQIENIHIPGTSVVSLTPEMSVIVTVVWIVAFINIINLIDGLDGLAAGVTCITAAAMFYFVTETGVHGPFVVAALISIVIVGTTLGFLRYNFYPAKIFMGDSGSMLLGFLLGALTIQGVLKSIAAVALVIPLLAVAIPILDTGMAIFRRIRRGRPVTHADKEHIHHRLLNLGHSQRQVVLLIYFWTALLCCISLALKFMAGNKYIYLILALTLVAFAVTALPRIARGNSRGKHRAGKGSRRSPGEARGSS